MNDITKIAEMMVELVSAQLGEGLTLTDIEQATRQMMQEVGRETVRMKVESLTPAYAAPRVVCACGAEARYVRRRPAKLHTLFGKVVVKRAYYLCDDCHQGSYPLDAQLGLRPNALSAEVCRLAAMTGVQLPFETGRALFEALTLVSVSDQAMAKATQGVGAVVMAREETQGARAQDAAFIRRQGRTGGGPVRLYGSIDATKVHIRDDSDYRWRDLKLGAWFEAAGQPPKTPDDEWTIQARNIRYYTDICPASSFGDLVWSSGVACQAHLAHELVMLGDGADWIWNLVDTCFPRAVQILDWFHACEHLLPVAQAALATQEQQQEWVSRMKDLLWQGRIPELIAACDTLAEHCDHDVIRTTANYFETHQKRMRYDYFRRQGYQIGSGTIESAAKQIGTMRMKVPGAIWNETSARQVAKARAAFLSDQWQSLPLAV